MIQLFGGVGDPSAEAHAARLTQRFADLTGAKPTFLLAPGIATSPEAREALMQDQFVQEAMAALDHVTLALVGIGALEPSSLLQRSGNIFSEDELQALGARSAVGDICLRFFDAAGRPVASDFDRRVTEVPPAAKEPKSPGETTASRRARSPIRRTLRNPVSTVRRLCAAARRSGGALRSEGMEPAGTALGTQRADRRGAPLKEPFRQPRPSGCAIDRAGCRAGRSPLPAAE